MLLHGLRGPAPEAVREARRRRRDRLRHRHPGGQHHDQRLGGGRRLRDRARRGGEQQGAGPQAARRQPAASAAQPHRAQRGADAERRQALSADGARSQGIEDRHQLGRRLDRHDAAIPAARSRPRSEEGREHRAGRRSRDHAGGAQERRDRRRHGGRADADRGAARHQDRQDGGRRRGRRRAAVQGIRLQRDVGPRCLPQGSAAGRARHRRRRRRGRAGDQRSGPHRRDHAGRRDLYEGHRSGAAARLSGAGIVRSSSRWRPRRRSRTSASSCSRAI